MRKISLLKTNMIAAKRILAMACLSLFYSSTYAESAGAAAIGKATSMLQGYSGAVQKLLYTIAGIIALIGAFNVFFKMQNGDQDVKKTILQTVGGCIAFVAMAAGLPLFFGNN